MDDSWIAKIERKLSEVQNAYPLRRPAAESPRKRARLAEAATADRSQKSERIVPVLRLASLKRQAKPQPRTAPLAQPEAAAAANPQQQAVRPPPRKAKKQLRPPKCTCGKPIHSERCRLFQPTYHQTFVPGVPAPNLRQRAAKTGTPSIQPPLWRPVWRPPQPTTSAPSVPSEPPLKCSLPLRCSRWARTQILGIMQDIDKLPKDRSDLRKAEWRRQLLIYHPDKRQSSNQFVGQTETELGEVFQEIKKRYDQFRS